MHFLTTFNWPGLRQPVRAHSCGLHRFIAGCGSHWSPRNRIFVQSIWNVYMDFPQLWVFCCCFFTKLWTFWFLCPAAQSQGCLSNCLTKQLEMEQQVPNCGQIVLRQVTLPPARQTRPYFPMSVSTVEFTHLNIFACVMCGFASLFLNYK